MQMAAFGSSFEDPASLEKMRSDVRKIRTYVYVENYGRKTICKDSTDEECHKIVFLLFEPTIKRFKEEFGIEISITKIIEYLPIGKSLSISSNDKNGLETLFMYQRSLNLFSQGLRMRNENVDVVVGIVENLSTDSSSLHGTYYGTILLNARHPALKRNIIHEFGHIFCAKDNRESSVIMNGYGIGLEDKFLLEDIRSIFQYKNRKFPYPYPEDSQKTLPYEFECK